ncbi:MAG: hypothetical protein KJ072_28710 [Verrucomicrobia bacterium]|nr:hypothetical protein [Verrucomicrobiota bacterium]
MFGAMTARTTKGNMKNGTESKKETTPKAPKAKTKSQPAAKPAETAKRTKEPADRLPATVEELKAGKAGLATHLFLSGKGKEEIAGELKAAFKLSDTQAAKITRRVLGRARFFQRALSLVTAK